MKRSKSSFDDFSTKQTLCEPLIYMYLADDRDKDRIKNVKPHPLCIYIITQVCYDFNFRLNASQYI